MVTSQCLTNDSKLKTMPRAFCITSYGSKNYTKSAAPGVSTSRSIELPSIELICIGQKNPIDCSSYSFPVEPSKELISNRAHSSSFQSDFELLNGCMYRVHEEKGRTAYELLKKDWHDEEGKDNGIDNDIKFIPEHDSSFVQLIKDLIQTSPVGEIVFTSDYQFGPEEYIRFEKLTISEFIIIYRNKGLRMNSSYRIKKC